ALYAKPIVVLCDFVLIAIVVAALGSHWRGVSIYVGRTNWSVCLLMWRADFGIIYNKSARGICGDLVTMNWGVDTVSLKARFVKNPYYPMDWEHEACGVTISARNTGLFQRIVIISMWWFATPPFALMGLRVWRRMRNSLDGNLVSRMRCARCGY